MANKRIYQLDVSTGITSDNYLVIDSSSYEKSQKTSVDNLKDYMLSGVSYAYLYGNIKFQLNDNSLIYNNLLFKNSGDTIVSKYNYDKLISYSNDTYSPSEWITQQNGLWLDGNLNSDKQIVWSSGDTTSWSIGTYRGESDNFFYFNSEKAHISPLTFSRSGRVGICKQSNQMSSYASMVVGTGLNDLTISGDYTKLLTAVYEIQIQSPITVDRFRWRKSSNYGMSYGSYSTTTNITGSEQLIENGVYIKFNSTTGHTTNDTWRIIAFSQVPTGTFSVSPAQYEKVLTVSNYSTFENKLNVTAEANSSMLDKDISILSATTYALYIAAQSPCPETFFNIKTTRNNVTLVCEYWNSNSSSWTTMNSSHDLLDGTSNFTQNGSITFTPSLMTGWRLSSCDVDSDEYYWMRLRTTTVPTIGAVILNNIAKHGDKRFSVFSEYSDPVPSFYVDSIGRTSIGGSNIVGSNIIQIAPKNSSTGGVFNVSTSFTSSLIEIDSDNGLKSDFLFRLSTATALAAPGIIRAKSSGNLTTPSNISQNHILGWDVWSGYINNNWRMTAYMQAKYTGTGTTASYNTDISFWTASGSDVNPYERLTVRHDGNVGIGVNNPTSKLYVNGNIFSSSGITSTNGIKIGNDTSVASADNEGTIKYVSNESSSSVQICMKTGIDTYEWKTIQVS